MSTAKYNRNKNSHYNICTSNNKYFKLNKPLSRSLKIHEHKKVITQVWRKRKAKIQQNIFTTFLRLENY